MNGTASDTFRCPECEHRITRIAWESAYMDFLCPRCRVKHISEFILEIKNEQSKIGKTKRIPEEGDT